MDLDLGSEFETLVLFYRFGFDLRMYSLLGWSLLEANTDFISTTGFHEISCNFLLTVSKDRFEIDKHCLAAFVVTILAFDRLNSAVTVYCAVHE